MLLVLLFGLFIPWLAGNLNHEVLGDLATRLCLVERGLQWCAELDKGCLMSSNKVPQAMDGGSETATQVARLV